MAPSIFYNSNVLHGKVVLHILSLFYIYSSYNTNEGKEIDQKNHQRHMTKPNK